jgi:hypothetical protein
MIKSIISLTVVTIFWGCSVTKMVERLETAKMPTQYAFAIGIDSLKKTIKKEFIRKKMVPDSVDDNRRSLEEVNPADYYALKGGSIDTLELPTLHLLDEYLGDALVISPIGISHNYRFVGTNIHPIYRTRFLLVFEALNENQTNIKVYPINPEIAIGSEFKWNNHTLWWYRAAIMHVAESSTIEEYQILLRIGEALGAVDKMPKYEWK